jgi:hypothetical protein
LAEPDRSDLKAARSGKEESSKKAARKQQQKQQQKKAAEAARKKERPSQGLVFSRGQRARCEGWKPC